MAPIYKKKQSILFLIGYINLFKNKTGFSFPVFRIDGIIYMQDGNDLDKPSKDLLKKKNQFFHEFSEPHRLKHNLEKERLSIFVYNGGQKHVLISNMKPESLDKISERHLTEMELRELRFYRSKKAVYLVLKDLIGTIKNYSPGSEKVERLYQSSKTLLNSSGSFNINVLELWFENTSFFEIVLDKSRENYKILSVWLSLVRFQKLSRKDQIYIHSDIFPQLITQGDNRLLKLVYYLAIKHKNISISRELFKIDFNNKMELIVEVLETIHRLELQKNPYCTEHISFIITSLEDYFKTIPLNEYKPIMKSRLEELQRILEEREILESFQKLIGSNLLPLVNDEFDGLIEHYCNRNN